MSICTLCVVSMYLEWLGELRDPWLILMQCYIQCSANYESVKQLWFENHLPFINSVFRLQYYLFNDIDFFLLVTMLWR